MTPIAELRELHAKATPGPWEIGHPMERNYIYGGNSHLGCIGSRDECFWINDDGSLNESETNAALIVAMRNALPTLLDALEAALGERDLRQAECDAKADIIADLEKRHKETKRLCIDQAYMTGALVNMLGPNALKVWDQWRVRGVQRVHYDWQPAAKELSGEERAALVLEWDEAAKNAEPIEDFDGHLAAIRRAAEQQEVG